MATKTFTNARIQTKRDTAANWEKNNPVLLNGEEIIVDTSAGEVRKKIGDGTKTYTQLPFTDESIRTLLSGKVDKVSGKGLSTNDYTTTEKEKLSTIEDGANKYIHPTYGDQSSGLYKITITGGHVSAATAVTKTDITGLGVPAQDTNTTYEIESPVSADNGNVKLNLLAGGIGGDDSTVSIVGSGATKVTTDADGVITISSTDNNTTYSNATTTTDGLLSAADKQQVDKIAALELKLAQIEEKLKNAVFYG